MTNVRNAIIFSFLSKYAGLTIQLCGTMVLARILNPQDFGIFAIAFVFVALADVLKNAGITQYLIKEKEVNQDKIRSAFAILIFSSFSLAAILYLSSSVIAEFYDEPKLRLMIQLLSINLLISPFGSIITALLERNLNFQPAFIASVTSKLVSYTAMVFWAMKGYHELSLVLGSIVSTLTVILVMQFYRLPETPLLPGFGKIKEVLHYTKFVLVSSLTTQTGRHYAEMAVGKFYSVETVGLLNRAIGLADLFNQLFTHAFFTVVMPFISKSSRKGVDLRDSIKTITDIQLSLAWPFYAILAFLSEPIIYLLFGPQWTDASPYLTIICLTNLINSTSQHFLPIFNGLGLAKQIMNIQLPINFIRIALITVTVSLGVEQMLWSLVLVELTNLTYIIHLTKVHLHLDVKKYFFWVLSNSVTTAVTLLPLLLFFIVKIEGEMANEIAFMFVSVLFCAIIWCFAVWNKTIGILFRRHFFNLQQPLK